MCWWQGKVAAQAGDLAEARALFMEAIASEADCVEAIYNLGLVSKALGNLEDALTAFKKLNSVLTGDAAAMFQVLLHLLHKVVANICRSSKCLRMLPTNGGVSEPACYAAHARHMFYVCCLLHQ